MKFSVYWSKKKQVPILNGLPCKRSRKADCGIARIVFISPCKKYVVKVELDHASDQCEEEWKRYNKLPYYWRRFAAKVYAYGKIPFDGSSYVVQEYIQDGLPPEGLTKKMWRKIHKFERIAEMSDLHDGNLFKLRDGRVKIVDLGL